MVRNINCHTAAIGCIRIFLCLFRRVFFFFSLVACVEQRIQIEIVYLVQKEYIVLITLRRIIDEDVEHIAVFGGDSNKLHFFAVIDDLFMLNERSIAICVIILICIIVMSCVISFIIAAFHCCLVVLNLINQLLHIFFTKFHVCSRRIVCHFCNCRCFFCKYRNGISHTCQSQSHCRKYCCNRFFSVPHFFYPPSRSFVHAPRKKQSASQ